MSLSVYFATPIDAVEPERAEELRNVRNAVRSALTAPGFRVDGVLLFEPSEAWSVTVPVVDLDPRLQKVNNAAVLASDLVFAFLPSWGSTVGVPMEIQLAAANGIPVFVVRDKPSWALQQQLIYQFRDLAPAFDAVRSFVPGSASKPQVKWVQVDDRVKADPEPTLAHSDDAGFDLTYCGADDIVIPPGGAADVPSSVAMEFPPGVWGLLIGRSSTFRNRGVMVNPAVIDPGYRGPLWAVCRNISGDTVRITPGERIAQVVPLPALAPRFEVVQVAELSQTARGVKGFGSSGA